MSILFIILVIVKVHGQRFEINAMVSGIHENVDRVIGMKNFAELEADIVTRD